MPSYNLFDCPGCEHYFRVIWPRPIPSHLHRDSKIKFECPNCHEVNELCAFLVGDSSFCAQPKHTVQPLAISPRDPNPDPDASIKWQQNIIIRRAARFKAMYGN